jgi:alkanesulfonate monooxygenase SsuD/methylene tetrahydromethanopterin reductase-like flavin-dependent oxidoreductase (luciferase family)
MFRAPLARSRGATHRVRLGTAVLALPLRDPLALAKQVATLDVLSGGRVEFGYGAGWHERETRAYGYEFPPPAVRVARMEEGLTIIRGLWTGEPTTFAGAHHRVDAAKCLPPPVQRPHPPITMGGGGEKLLLRAVARHADIWNYFRCRCPPTSTNVRCCTRTAPPWAATRRPSTNR